MSVMDADEEQSRHLMKAGPAAGAIALLLLAASLFGGWATARAKRMESRHEDFVAARPPFHGRTWDRKEAVLYRDVAHPFTWHVCTEDGCGIYYEAGEAQK